MVILIKQYKNCAAKWTLLIKTFPRRSFDKINKNKINNNF